MALYEQKGKRRIFAAFLFLVFAGGPEPTRTSI